MKIIRIDSDDFAGQLIKVDFGDGNKLEYNVDEVKDTGIPIPAGTDYSQIKIYAAGRLYTDLLGETKLLKVAKTVSELADYYKWQTNSYDNGGNYNYLSVNACSGYTPTNYHYGYDGSGNACILDENNNVVYTISGGGGYSESNPYEFPLFVSFDCDDCYILRPNGAVARAHSVPTSRFRTLVFSKKSMEEFEEGDTVEVFAIQNYSENDGLTSDKYTYFGEASPFVDVVEGVDGCGSHYQVKAFIIPITNFITLLLSYSRHID